MILKRNRFGFRLRRRNISNLFIQGLVVFGVLSFFIYIILYAIRSDRYVTPPDYSWLKTRNMSLFLQPGISTTLVSPEKDSCGNRRNPPKKLRLIVIVYSAPYSNQRRKVIRKTWGKDILSYPGTKLFFILGKPNQPRLRYSDTLPIDIHNEAAVYKDIIQEDFIDSYVNLTVKTGFALKWAREHCGNAKFVFKVDDDVFVNPDNLWNSLDHASLHTTSASTLTHFLSSQDPTSSQSQGDSVDYIFMGHLMSSAPVRDMKSKYYIPPRFYPLNIFPNFISGTGYIISSSIIPMLYKCLLRTPYMNLEDVFISGLCGTTQMGLKLTHNSDFRFKKPFMSPNYICYYKKSITVHPITVTELEETWVKMQDEINCDTFYFSIITFLSEAIHFVRNIFRI